MTFINEQHLVISVKCLFFFCLFFTKTIKNGVEMKKYKCVVLHVDERGGHKFCADVQLSGL